MFVNLTVFELLEKIHVNIREKQVCESRRTVALKINNPRKIFCIQMMEQSFSYQNRPYIVSHKTNGFRDICEKAYDADARKISIRSFGTSYRPRRKIYEKCFESKRWMRFPSTKKVCTPIFVNLTNFEIF